MTVFITYTKGAMLYVTVPQYETAFLNWLSTLDKISSYTREVTDKIAVVCCPIKVHATEKKEAVVLKLIKDKGSVL